MDQVMRPGWVTRRLCEAIMVAAAALVQACGSPPGVMFDEGRAGPVWPAAPDVARIRYVGQLKSESDLAAPRSGLQSLGDAIFGRKMAAGMVSPMAVCTDDGSRVFVADSGGQCVHVLDTQTRAYQRWSLAETPMRLLQPVGVAYDASGRLLVADSQAGYVVALDRDGRQTGVLGRGILRRPVGLALERGGGGGVIVADAAAHQIVVLNADGSERRRIGERGNGPAQFNYPTYVATDRAGNVYVSDSLNFRVQVFDANLAFVRAIGRKGDMPGYFAQPKGVGVDSEGHLYVVDANFEAVQLFDQEGRLLMTFGSEGRGPGEFWLPVGISVDARDRIWVADSQNKRVQVFDYLPERVRP